MIPGYVFARAGPSQKAARGAAAPPRCAAKGMLMPRMMAAFLCFIFWGPAGKVGTLAPVCAPALGRWGAQGFKKARKPSLRQAILL
jgi:hypothetical protein